MGSDDLDTLSLSTQSANNKATFSQLQKVIQNQMANRLKYTGGELDNGTQEVLLSLAKQLEEKIHLLPQPIINELYLRQRCNKQIAQHAAVPAMMVKKYQFTYNTIQQFVCVETDEEEQFVQKNNIIQGQNELRCESDFSFGYKEPKWRVMRSLELNRQQEQNNVLILTDFYQFPTDLCQVVQRLAGRWAANIAVPCLQDVVNMMTNLKGCQMVQHFINVLVFYTRFCFGCGKYVVMAQGTSAVLAITLHKCDTLCRQVIICNPICTMYYRGSKQEEFTYKTKAPTEAVHEQISTVSAHRTQDSSGEDNKCINQTDHRGATETDNCSSEISLSRNNRAQRLAMRIKQEGPKVEAKCPEDDHPRTLQIVDHSNQCYSHDNTVVLNNAIMEFYDPDIVQEFKQEFGLQNSTKFKFHENFKDLLYALQKQSSRRQIALLQSAMLQLFVFQRFGSFVFDGEERLKMGYFRAFRMIKHLIECQVLVNQDAVITFLVGGYSMTDQRILRQINYIQRFCPHIRSYTVLGSGQDMYGLLSDYYSQFCGDVLFG